MNLKALFHIYVHKSFSYSLPSAGRKLTWDCECIKCGARFTVRRPNTPQWVSPIKRDRSRPKAWFLKMFLVRLFGPKDPFHKRKSYFEKRKNGEMFAQISIGEWALMFGIFDVFEGMNRFLIVNSDVV